MLKFKYIGKVYEAWLVDKGDLDTHVTVQDLRSPYYIVTGHFSHEFAADYRAKDGRMTKNGLKQLAIATLEDDSFDDTNCEQQTEARK